MNDLSPWLFTCGCYFVFLYVVVGFIGLTFVASVADVRDEAVKWTAVMLWPLIFGYVLTMAVRGFIQGLFPNETARRVGDEHSSKKQFSISSAGFYYED